MGATPLGIRYIDPDQPIAQVAQYQEFMAEDVDELLTAAPSSIAGNELDYALLDAPFYTTDTGLSTIIPGLSVTCVGEGRPVLVEFFAPNVYHSVAGTIVVFYLVVDGVPLTSDGTVGDTFSNRTDIGPSMYLRRRTAPLDDGVERTFQVGMFGQAAGTSTLMNTYAAPTELELTQK